MQPLSRQEQHQIIQIRLLIAFAAQMEHLNWWEDYALSTAGAHLLDRAFVFAPEEAGRKLALRTAKRRYEATFETEPDSIYLFRLEPTGEVEYHLRQVDVMKLTLPKKTINTMDALKEELSKLSKTEPGYTVTAQWPNHRLEIRLVDDAMRTNPLYLTQVLAWATLEGKPGAPIFPFLSRAT